MYEQKRSNLLGKSIAVGPSLLAIALPVTTCQVEMPGGDNAGNWIQACIHAFSVLNTAGNTEEIRDRAAANLVVNPEAVAKPKAVG